MASAWPATSGQPAADLRTALACLREEIRRSTVRNYTTTLLAMGCLCALAGACDSRRNDAHRDQPQTIEQGLKQAGQALERGADKAGDALQRGVDKARPNVER